MKSLKSWLTVAAVAASAAVAAPAQAAFYLGDTTGGPTFNRALSDFSDLSGVGTDVAYDVFAFGVDTAGTYTINSFAYGYFGGPLASESWDNYLLLYVGSFDPAAALDNGLAGNDDFNGIGRSQITVDLMTDTAYYLVTTGFGNADYGRFLNIIKGPGAVVPPPVPEPSTYAMLAMGLLAIGFGVRRRAKSDQDV